MMQGRKCSGSTGISAKPDAGRSRRLSGAGGSIYPPAEKEEEMPASEEESYYREEDISRPEE